MGFNVEVRFKRENIGRASISCFDCGSPAILGNPSREAYTGLKWHNLGLRRSIEEQRDRHKECCQHMLANAITHHTPQLQRVSEPFIPLARMAMPTNRKNRHGPRYGFFVGVGVGEGWEVAGGC